MSSRIVAGLTDTQLQQWIRTRLVSAADLRTEANPDGAWPMGGYARRVGDELAVVLAVDLPDGVCYLDDETALRLDLQALFARAQANTDDEPVSQTYSLTEGLVTVAAGESPFIASKALNMPALLSQVSEADAADLGVLFAVPDAGGVLLHRVTGPGSEFALVRMAGFVDHRWNCALADDDGAPISPHIFHWYRGAIRAVSRRDDDVHTLTLTPELEEILHPPGGLETADEWLATISEPGPVVADGSPDHCNLTAAEFHDRLRIRLRHNSQLGPRVSDTDGTEYTVGMAGYARPIAEDLSLTLMLDFPDTHIVVTDEIAAHHDLDALFARARHNSHAQPPGPHYFENDDRFVVFGNPPINVSTRVLSMPALLTEAFERPDAPYGVVFGIPDRDLVVLHRVTGSGCAEDIEGLAMATFAQYHESGQPISPNTYFWHNGTITRIIEYSPDARYVLADLPPILRDLIATDEARLPEDDGVDVDVDLKIDTVLNAGTDPDDTPIEPPRPTIMQSLVPEHKSEVVIAHSTRDRHRPNYYQLTEEQFYQSVRVRLCPNDQLDTEIADQDGLTHTVYRSGHARPVTDDLSAVLLVELARYNVWITDDDTRDYDLPALFARAQQNTDDAGSRGYHFEDDENIVVFDGPSYSTAAKALNLPALLSREFHDFDTSRGVAFGIPARNELLLHRVEGPESRDRISTLARMVADRHAGSSTALSPNVYYWLDGTITRISHVDPDANEIVLDPPDTLRAFLFPGAERDGKDRNDAPDPTFPHLTVSDVAWIRARAMHALAQQGVEATPADNGADLIGADGLRFALDNVVTTCINATRDLWPGLIDEHFGAMARSRHNPSIDDLSPEQLLTQVRTRLLPTEALTAQGVSMAGYARPVADGLAAVICFDFPETVSYLDEGRAAHLDLDALFRAGQRNTDAEPIDEVVPVADTDVIGIFGESVFTSSKVLNMAGLVAQVFKRDAPYGVVFAVPDRSCVLLHLVESIAMIPAIGQITETATRMYGTATWAVSPNAFHWYRNRITQVSTMDEANNTVALTASGDLMAVIEHLRAISEGRA